MIRVLIVDDEANIRQMIAEVLSNYCEGAEVIGQAGSVADGVRKISDLAPDLVLLDIKMDDGTGFDLLEQVDPPVFKVIFITAYEEYAIKAIKFAALDYIMKPVDPLELIRALKQATEIVPEHQQKQLSHLAESVRSGGQQAKKILLKTADSIHLVRFEDIIFCEADSGYTRFHLQNRHCVLISKSLSEYEGLLSGFGFFRIHKTYLVNVHKIMRFDREDGGHIVMEEEHNVPVASRKRDQLIEIMEKLAQ